MVYTGIVPKTILAKGSLRSGIKARLLRRASKTKSDGVRIYTTSRCLKEIPAIEAGLSDNTRAIFYAALELAGQLYSAMPMLDGKPGKTYEKRFADREALLINLRKFADYIEGKGLNINILATQPEAQANFQAELMDWFNLKIPEILQEAHIANLFENQGPFEYWISRFNHSFPHEAEDSWKKFMLVFDQIQNSDEAGRLEYRLLMALADVHNIFKQNNKDFLVSGAAFKHNFIRYCDWLIPKVKVENIWLYGMNWYEIHWIMAVSVSLNSSGFSTKPYLDFRAALSNIEGGEEHWVDAYSEILTEAIALMVPRNEEDKRNIKETLEGIARGKWQAKFPRASRLAGYILNNEKLASLDSSYEIKNAISSGARSVADHPIFLSYVLRRKYKSANYTPPARLVWAGRVIDA